MARDIVLWITDAPGRDPVRFSVPHASPTKSPGNAIQVGFRYAPGDAVRQMLQVRSGRLIDFEKTLREHGVSGGDTLMAFIDQVTQEEARAAANATGLPPSVGSPSNLWKRLWKTLSEHILRTIFGVLAAVVGAYLIWRLGLR